MTVKEVNVKEELEAIRLEKEKLELITLRHQVATIQAARDRATFNHASVENDLADQAMRAKAQQDYCNHRQGGMGMDGITGRGTASNYAVIKHRLPLGQIMAMCFRCQKIWLPGTSGYSEALSYPTGNTMSESSQFVVTQNA